MLERGGFIAALRGHQEESHQAAERARRGAVAERLAGLPDRDDLLVGQDAVALALRALANVGDEIVRDQVLLRGPFEYRAEIAEEPVRLHQRVPGGDGIAGGPQIGLGELLRRKSEIGAQPMPQGAHCGGQRFGACAFARAQRFIAIDQRAERESARRAWMHRWRCAGWCTGIETLDQVAGLDCAHRQARGQDNNRAERGG